MVVQGFDERAPPNVRQESPILRGPFGRLWQTGRFEVFRSSRTTCDVLARDAELFDERTSEAARGLGWQEVASSNLAGPDQPFQSDTSKFLDYGVSRCR